MATVKVELTKHPHWERQPKEPKGQWECFAYFLKLGPGRSLDAVAEKMGKTKHTIWDYSKCGQWRARIEAYNTHYDQIWFTEHEAERRAAARQDAAVLRTGLSAAAAELQQLTAKAGSLTIDQTIRLLDVTMRYRRMLYGDPSEGMTHPNAPAGQQAPGGAGQPMQVEIRHFTELSDQGKVNALKDLIKENQQWLAAAEDKDDD